MNPLRLLFICDEYPPLEQGGYAQLCYDLAHALRERKHQVTVLCAASRQQLVETEPVVRELRIPVCYEDRWPVPIQQIMLASSRRRHNLRVLKRVLNETQAQAVLFWPTYYVDPELMLMAEHIPNLVVSYYIAGFSPTQPSLLNEYWSHPGQTRVARLAKSFLRPMFGKCGCPSMPLALRHVMCVSEYERQRAIRDGVSPSNALVVRNGIDLTQFRFLGLPSTRRQPGAPLRVLYSGRLAETKGAHTAIEAVRWLHQTEPRVVVCLALLGTGKPDYVHNLDQRIVAYGLVDRVKRYDWIPRDQVPDFMAGFDVLVLPTVHPEPLAG